MDTRTIERIAVDSKPRSKRSSVGRVVAVVVAGLSLYVLLPGLLRVVSSWPRLSTLEPWWLLVALLAESTSFVCAMALLRLVLRTKSWFAVVTAGLAGNAVTNTLPGGDAVGASVQYRMLAGTGIDRVQAAGGLAVSSIIGIAALFSLPIFALPVIVGGASVSAGLVRSGVLGAIGFILIVLVGVVILTTDRALVMLGKVLEWLLRKMPRRRRDTRNLSVRLLAERDAVRADLGQNWWKAVLLVAGRIGLDYLSLIAVLEATGTRPNESLVLLAYAATAVIALLPLTPGGLGLVEASLSGLLVLANVPTANAVLATLAYRLGSYWLPTMAGGVCYVLYRRRYGPLGQSETVGQPER
ncbi:MAG TPA: lysylphosphatidylglycerol synthase transmembrane domain-containing protein [Acidimicrobiales bacterium]|nr:lysylphosphatidylglycerol synthase transmembrane domain-containing protein [Acidimicrobiales bacterium]